MGSFFLFFILRLWVTISGISHMRMWREKGKRILHFYYFPLPTTLCIIGFVWDLPRHACKIEYGQNLPLQRSFCAIDALNCRIFPIHDDGGFFFLLLAYGACFVGIAPSSSSSSFAMTAPFDKCEREEDSPPFRPTPNPCIFLLPHVISSSSS